MDHFHKKLTINTPQGFFYFPDFLTSQEEAFLLKKIIPLNWQEVRMHGIQAKRRVVHFGLDYAYNTRRVIPTTPAPVFLQSYMKRAAEFLEINPGAIAEILITEYSIGAGIGWHKDAPIFGDKVFGISLGGMSTLKLRLKTGDTYESFKTELIPGSAYILSGPARTTWQHSIPPVKQPRYSITFRTLKESNK